MERGARFAPLAGVVAVVLWIVGTFLLENTDRPDEDVGSNFRDWVQANDTELLVGTIAFASGVAASVSMLFTVLPHAQAAFDIDSTANPRPVSSS